MFQAPTINFLLILPVIIVVVWAMLLMIVDLFLPKDKKIWLAVLSLIGIGLALIQAVGLWGYEGGTFTPAGGTPMVAVDNYGTFLNVIILITAFITVLVSVNYLPKANLDRGEFYYLMLFSISGMMLMGMANDLILVFLALELLSIPLYVLAGFARPRVDSEESAMKYFLLGAYASGFLVFGIAFIYGATGTTALPAVVTLVGDGGQLALAGAVLILVGLSFKVAAVPFHMWTPDVYEGAPTAVTAFMSVGAKVAGFAALMRIFLYALPEISDAWVPILATIAALTLLVGNIVALAQQNIKRMLAYSSIAHAGFIMIGVTAAGASGSTVGLSAGLFYMMAYLFTNLGAFAVVLVVERREGQGVMIDDYKGLARRNPLLALVFAYFMLSLTGIPPSGGFTAKFSVFGAAVDAGMVWLAIVGVLTSIVSAYFYLRPVFYAFMFDGEGEVSVRPATTIALAITAAATIILGIYTGPILELAREAVFSSAQLLAGG
jgi:NADH-quinone oxidoreductase subunit N